MPVEHLTFFKLCLSLWDSDLPITTGSITAETCRIIFKTLDFLSELGSQKKSWVRNPGFPLLREGDQFCETKLFLAGLSIRGMGSDLDPLARRSLPRHLTRSENSIWEMGRMRFWRVQFQALNSLSCMGPHLTLDEGKRPPPQDFSLTKKTTRFTKGQFRPY